jgi:hypothetical protein
MPHYIAAVFVAVEADNAEAAWEHIGRCEDLASDIGATVPFASALHVVTEEQVYSADYDATLSYGGQPLTPTDEEY